MDPDLQDLLAVWAGGEVDPARQAELMARLRADAGFRRAFVEEIRLLGKLKAVQSTEPRWLALGDELGWGADGPAPEASLEDRVLGQLAEPPPPSPPPRASSWRWPAALAASVLLVAGVSLFALFRGTGPAPSPDAPAYVAVLVKSDGAQWAPGGADLAEGSAVPGGRLRLKSGRATLALFSGVVLSMEGPADLDLREVDRVYCHQGKVRARVPAGAEGFVMLAPGSAVVDLGTEFALNVVDGKVDLMLFEGKAEVSVLNAKGHTLRSELLEGQKAVNVDAGAGRIREAPLAPGSFTPAPELIAPALRLPASYRDAVLGSNPWSYWRFEELGGGVVRNEVAGRPVLRATGPLALGGAPGDNRCVHFRPTKAEQHLLMDDVWPPPRPTGFAVEAWVLPEEVNVGALVGLTARADEPGQKHIFLLELAGRGHHLVHEPCTVRYLDRWPAAYEGGVNTFSRRMYVPYRWHHVVAQRVEDRMELYLNGELTGTTSIDPADATTACRLLVGRLRRGAQQSLNQTRPFIGRLDELAVYEHPLPPAEIRRHFELGSVGPVGTP